MVRQAVERSLAQYRTDKVVLIGQSFGAEALVIGFGGCPLRCASMSPD